MRARLTALNPAPVALPFDVEAGWQPRPFGYAASHLVDTDDPEQMRLSLVEVASGGVVTGPLATEPARLVMMDVDSTLTTTEAIDLLASHAGTGGLVASITERAMRGELDFESSLRERVATLRGLPAGVFGDVLPCMTLSPGARELIAALHEAGVRVGVTSGGFSALVGPLAEELCLDFFNANHLEVRNGHLTGQVTGTVVDRAQKARDLTQFAQDSGVPLEYAVAVGRLLRETRDGDPGRRSHRLPPARCPDRPGPSGSWVLNGIPWPRGNGDTPMRSLGSEPIRLQPPHAGSSKEGICQIGFGTRGSVPR